MVGLITKYDIDIIRCNYNKLNENNIELEKEEINLKEIINISNKKKCYLKLFLIMILFVILGFY